MLSAADTAGALDEATRNALSLISSYLSRAYDTIRPGPLGQEDAKLIIGYLDDLAKDVSGREASATAIEAGAAIRQAIAKARENAWDFEAFHEALNVMSLRVYERAKTGINTAGAALDLSTSEALWANKVAEDERRAAADQCSFSAFLTGERTLSDAWKCVPAPVKYGAIALLALTAYNAVRR